MAWDDDDDWVGEPPEGHYSRDRAKPDFWRTQRAPQVLVAILLFGFVLRLALTLGWQPALFGWPDAASYIDVAHGQLFGNELRPAGYPLFLRGLHAVAPSLLLVVVVQHVLGLATAVVLYLTV